MRGAPEGSSGRTRGRKQPESEGGSQRAWPGELRGPWREERFLEGEREPEGRGRPQRVEKAPEGASQGEGDFRVRKVWPWVSGGFQGPVGGDTPGGSLLLEHVCASPFVFQSLSHLRLFDIPWTTACQASLSFTVLQSLLKLTSIEVVEAIQTSYPLLHSSPALSLSQHQSLF